MPNILRALCLIALITRPLSAGFSQSPDGLNKALLVGVSQGLPGLGFDIDNLKRILAHPNNGFTSEILRDAQANVADIAKALTKVSAAVDSRGDFFFYFTGHGNKNVVLAQDRTMKITEIRSALEEGRKDWGPLRRLILFFDSCYSGTLLEPLRAFWEAMILPDPIRESEDLAENLFETFSPERNRDAYWTELFVFASANANETCEASSSGSAFTNALAKAFDATVGKGTLAEFVAKTKTGTSGSHPTERFSPAALASLKL